MLSIVRNLFRRKPVKTDALLNKDPDDLRMQNAQFVSFLQQSGFRKRQLDKHAKSKKLKRAIALVAIWAFLLGFVWVAIESAQALEIF